MSDLERKRALATYEVGWRDYDRGGSYAVRRRRFAARVGEHPDAVALWEQGWADNQHGRGFGESLATPTSQQDE